MNRFVSTAGRWHSASFSTWALQAAFVLLLVLPLSVRAAENAGQEGSTGQEEKAGQLMFVHGTVVHEQGGKSNPARRGASVFQGDRLVTASASSVQIRFTDGGTLAVKPNSEITISEYTFTDNAEASFQKTDIVRGGLRSITGAIGHRKPENVSFRTPVATIGIRGTIIRLLHFTEGGSDLPAGTRSGSYLMVEQGAAAATTTGTRVIRAGQALAMYSPDTLPEAFPADSAIFNAGAGQLNPNPPPGNPEEGEPRRRPENAGPGLGLREGDIRQPEIKEQLLREEGEQDLVEAACREEGFISCADKEAKELAELQCRNEGFTSCSAKEFFLMAEAACRAEGYTSCSAKEFDLLTEAACQSEGYESCQEKELFLLAEAACQAEGYASCQAKELFLLAEAACQAEGYASCQAKEAYLAAEAICQSAGYASCADKALAEQIDSRCTLLGYDSCAHMISTDALNPISPSAQGRLLASTAGSVLSFDGAATQWEYFSDESGEDLPVLVGANLSGTLRLQRKMPGSSTAKQQNLMQTHPDTNSKTYLGVWPQSEFFYLNPVTLSNQGTPLDNLVYAASDSVMDDPVELESLMSSGAVGGLYDFVLTADTSGIQPVMGDMQLSDMEISLDTMDMRMRGYVLFDGGSGSVQFVNNTGVSVTDFLASGMNFSGDYFPVSGSAVSANGYFVGGFSGNVSAVDGMFGVLYGNIPSLSLSGEAGVALMGTGNGLPPSGISPYYGLAGLSEGYGLNYDIMTAECVLACDLGGTPESFETSLTLGGMTMALRFSNSGMQSPLNSYTLPDSSKVLWGVWAEADYDIDSSDPSLSHITKADIGLLPFMFTQQAPILSDITELQTVTGSSSVNFQLAAGGDIYDSMGSPVMTLGSSSNLELDFTTSYMSIYLDFGSDGALEANSLPLPDINGFNEISLTTVSTPPALSGGFISGRFAGTEAEAAMLMIETLGIDGKGVAIFER
ncbi:FecR domain-containing protein [Oceanospirillum sp.]|uniref:FecR domain-containing protein n=1 Tax=Oceanospirillum sp. TaxID=2021254 RepID=UPI003A946A6C